jgi:hypothetical protein
MGGGLYPHRLNTGKKTRSLNAKFKLSREFIRDEVVVHLIQHITQPSNSVSVTALNTAVYQDG